MSNELPPGAVDCCHKNNHTLLQNIIQTKSVANSVQAHFRYRTLSRTNVPLVSIAVACGSIKCIDVLVSRQASLDAEDGSGSRPIHWACLTGQPEVLKALLALGVKPNPPSSPGVASPLLIVAKSGDLECMRILLQANADITQQDGSGRKPLHLVCWFGHSAAVQMLIDKGAPLSAISSALDNVKRLFPDSSGRSSSVTAGLYKRYALL
jgi:ankyrin repeat protein